MSIDNNQSNRSPNNATKRGTGSVFPEGAIDSGGGPERIEPMLTAKQLKQRMFKGFDLVSPINGEKWTMSDLKDTIKRATAQFEVDAQVKVAPLLLRKRLPFDPNLYHQFIYCDLPDKPISLVRRLAICSASYIDIPLQSTDAAENVNPQNLVNASRYPSGAQIYQIPTEWIEMGNAVRGLLNVNPINPAFSAIGITTSVAASGATILQFIGQQGWVPAYWTVEYVVGFCSLEGNVPVVVNECIAQKAALMVIDQLILLFKIANQSLNMDGLGQSVSDLTYQLLMEKRKQLVEDYKAGVHRIKMMTGNTMFSSNV